MRFHTGAAVLVLVAVVGAGCGDDSSLESGPEGERIEVDGSDDTGPTDGIEPATDGGDDTGEEVAPTTTGSTETVPTTTGGEDGPTPPDTLGPDVEETTTTSAGPVEAAWEEYCEMGMFLADQTARFEQLEDEGDISDVARIYREMATAMTESASSSPDPELAVDTTTLAEAILELATVLDEYSGPFVEAMLEAADDPRLAPLFEDDSELDRVSDNIEDALDVHCGVDL